MHHQSESTSTRIPPSKFPRSFICPLTMEVMVDPVIDAEGNTYERKALLHWLSHYGVSPISRQPLNASLVVPNFALRDTIHEIMGASWVVQRTEEVELQYSSEEEDCLNDSSTSSLDSSSSSLFSAASVNSKKKNKYRGKIQCYLTRLAQEVGGGRMPLELDEHGVCMFCCDNMTIVVEVPEDVGFFFIYTVVRVPCLSEESKDMMLELNRIQSETRGGTLSTKKYESGQYDVYFSYSDRIDEISAADFCNIVPNFIDTASRLKRRFLGEDQQQDAPTQMAPQSSSSSSSPAVGMTAKYL